MLTLLLQVCCYEKDIQTGKFLIDKPMVQIDGQMLHPDAVRDADLYRYIHLHLVYMASERGKERQLLRDWRREIKKGNDWKFGEREREREYLHMHNLLALRIIISLL